MRLQRKGRVGFAHAPLSLNREKVRRTLLTRRIALDWTDVFRLHAFWTGNPVVLNGLVFIESLVAVGGGLYRRVMNENVGAPIARGDESEALFCVEPLYDALYHFVSLFQSV